MLEYFSYKKVKKHKEEKAEKERLEQLKKEANGKAESTPSSGPVVINEPEDQSVGTPVLDKEDERFLERLTSPEEHVNNDDDEGPPPPLPPRIPTPIVEWDSDTESFVNRGHTSFSAKDTDSQDQAADSSKKQKQQKDDDTTKKPKRFSLVMPFKRKPVPSHDDGLKPAQLAVPEREAHKEEADMSRILDDLNLAAQNNKAFSLSAESTEMARKFTQVLKDLVNGVPTAYTDLVSLIEDRDGILARNFEKLPKSLKKLVTQLPNKLTSSLAPELLAVAAEAQGIKTEKGSGIKGAAKSMLTPKNLHELVTKPGAVVGLLKGIVNALKVRWPAFIGTNVLWSVAVFLLLSVLWYCHKRGREERLLREAAEKEGSPIDGTSRVEELPDDPPLPAPVASGSANKGDVDQAAGIKLPPPPVGEFAESK